jgi:hypothetical protein
MDAKPELLIPITLFEQWHGDLEDEFTVRYVGKAGDRAAAIQLSRRTSARSPPIALAALRAS